MYGLTQTSAPIGEPVSVKAAKEWCRLDAAYVIDDDLIAALIAAARGYIERVSGRQLLTAGYTLALDGFPGGVNGSGNSARWGGLPASWRGSDWAFIDPWTIRLPRAPLQSVTGVTYYDLSGTLQTLPATVYDVDTSKDPGVLSLAQYQIWPITRLRPGSVQVNFLAGYGFPPDVPAEYVLAIKMLVIHWYERRGDDAGQQEIPPACNALLAGMCNGALEYGA